MRRSVTFIAAGAALAVAAGAAGGNQAIDPKRAGQYFEEAKALSDRDGGQLWGVPLHGPMLFVEPATRTVVANVADHEGLLAEQEGVFVGALPEEVGVANTAVEWAGRRWTMVMWPLPDDPADRGRLLMHESFHRLQPDLGLSTTEASNAHLDERDGRLWMRLEWEALSRALAADEKNRRALLDAILFREYRYQLFPDAVEQERLLELNEGLAEYTGLRASGASPDEQRRRATAALREAQQRESLVRSFAYVTGPAWGMLLDDADPGWRTSVSRQRDLDDLVRGAVGYEALEDLEARALDRATIYGYEQVLAAEEGRQRSRQVELEAARRRYVEGPLLIVPLAHPNLTFDPGRLTVVAGHGTVYGVLEVRDEWGTVEAEGGALLSDAFALHLPQPADVDGPTLAGDGWRLTLNDGWIPIPGPRPGDLIIGRAGT